MRKTFILVLMVFMVPGVISADNLWEDSKAVDEPFPVISTVLEGGILTRNQVNASFSKFIFTVPEEQNLVTWNIPLKGYTLVYQANYSASYLSPGGRWLVTIDWSDIKALDPSTVFEKDSLRLGMDITNMARSGAVDLDPSIEIDGPLGAAFRGLSMGKNGYEDSHGYFHTVIVPTSDRDIYHVWENAGGWQQEKVDAGGYTSLCVACAGFQNASGEYLAFVEGDDDNYFYFEIGADGDNTTNVYTGNINKQHGTLRCIYDYGYGEYRFFGNLYTSPTLYNGTLEDISTWTWAEPNHGGNYFGATSVAVKDYQNAMAIWGWENGTIIAAEWDGVSWASRGHVTDNGETTDNYDRGCADVTWLDYGGSTHYIVVYANSSMYLKYRLYNTTTPGWEDAETVDWITGPLDGSYSPKVETWNGTPQISCVEESDNHLYFWNVSGADVLGETPIPWDRYLMCSDDTGDSGAALSLNPKLDFHIANGSKVGHVTWANSSGVYYLDWQIGSDAPAPPLSWNITWLGTGTPCHCPEGIMLTWEILGNDSGYYRIYRNGSVRWDYDTWDSPCNISLVDICAPGYTNYTLWMNDSVGNVQTYTANFTDSRFFDDFDDCDMDGNWTTFDNTPVASSFDVCNGSLCMTGDGAYQRNEYISTYLDDIGPSWNWTATTNVTSFNTSSGWGKAGIMTRTDMADNSTPGIALSWSPRSVGTIQFFWDSNCDGHFDDYTFSADQYPLPVGLRLRRMNGTCTYRAYVNNWTGAGWQYLWERSPCSCADNLYQDIGLFQMSHGSSDIEIAESCFDHFELNYSVFTGSWVYGDNEIPTVEAWNSTDCCAHFRVTDEDDENGTYYVWNSTSDLLATGTWTNYTNFTYCVGSAGIWNITLWADDSCNWSGNNSNTSWVTCASSFECVNDTYIGDVFNVSFSFLSSVTGTPVRIGLYHNGSLIQSSYNYTTNTTWFPMIYAWQPNGTYTAVLQNLTGGAWTNVTVASCTVLVRPWPTHLILKAERYVAYPSANKVFWWKNDLDPRCEWYIESYLNDTAVSWAYLMAPGYAWDDYRQWPDLNWVSTTMWFNETQTPGTGYYTRLIGYYPDRATNLGNYTWSDQWQDVLRPLPSFSVSTTRYPDTAMELDVIVDFSNLSFWPDDFKWHPTIWDWAKTSAGQFGTLPFGVLGLLGAAQLDWKVGGLYGARVVVRSPDNDTVADYKSLTVGEGLPGRTSFDWSSSRHRVDGEYTFDGYILATNNSWVYIGSDTIELGQSTWNLVDSLAASLDALLGFGEGTTWLLILFTFFGLVLVLSTVVGHFFSGAVVTLIALGVLGFLGVIPVWAGVMIGAIGGVLLWVTGGRVSYG